MGSLDFLHSRALLKRGLVRVAGTNTPVAIRLRALTAAGAVTSVTIDTAVDLEIITENGGTDTYAFGTYTTVGSLVDAINADAMFEARILDSLRSKSTASNFVDGAITAATDDGVSYYDVKLDTSSALYFAVRLSQDRSVGENRVKGSHRIHLQEIKYLMNVGTAAADSVEIFEVDGTNETELFSYASVDNSATTHNFASGEGLLTSKEGAEIVVTVKDAGTLADAATNYLQVSGWAE